MQYTKLDILLYIDIKLFIVTDILKNNNAYILHITKININIKLLLVKIQ